MEHKKLGRKKQEKTLTAKLAVVLSLEERDLVGVAAEKAGMSCSAWLRKLAREAAEAK